MWLLWSWGLGCPEDPGFLSHSWSSRGHRWWPRWPRIAQPPLQSLLFPWPRMATNPLSNPGCVLDLTRSPSEAGSCWWWQVPLLLRLLSLWSSKEILVWGPGWYPLWAVGHPTWLYSNLTGSLSLFSQPWARLPRAVGNPTGSSGRSAVLKDVSSRLLGCRSWKESAEIFVQRESRSALWWRLRISGVFVHSDKRQNTPPPVDPGGAQAPPLEEP